MRLEQSEHSLLLLGLLLLLLGLLLLLLRLLLLRWLERWCGCERRLQPVDLRLLHGEQLPMIILVSIGQVHGEYMASARGDGDSRGVVFGGNPAAHGGGACGAAHLELLRERDKLRLHVRLLLGRHRGQRGRRLLQLLLPRTELRE